jgi:hypothetical protein
MYYSTGNRKKLSYTYYLPGLSYDIHQFNKHLLGTCNLQNIVFVINLFFSYIYLRQDNLVKATKIYPAYFTRVEASLSMSVLMTNVLPYLVNYVLPIQSNTIFSLRTFTQIVIRLYEL